MLDQQPGELVRPLVQLAIGQSGAGTENRRLVRGAGRLRLDQLRQHPRRHGLVGVVPLDQQPVCLGLGEQRQVGQPPLRVGGDRGQQPAQVPGQPFDRLGVEQVGAVLDGQVQPVRTWQELEDQVEPGRRAGQLLLGDPQAADFPRPHHRVLQHHQRLHQRGAARVPVRLQFLHQPVERHLVVAERVQHGLPDGGQELLEGQRAVHGRPQHHRVDEQPDQILQFRPAPAGGDRAHRDVPLVAVPRQQQLHRGEQGHEQRAAALLTDAGKPLDQLGRQVGAVHRAGGATDRRARAVGGQVEYRYAGQRSSPVADLLVQRSGGEAVPFPDRVVRVLDRQLGQFDRYAGHRRRVPLCQFVHQHPDRPAVGDDVVLAEHQHLLALRAPDQHGPGQRAAAQIERPVQLLGQRRFDGNRRTVHSG